MKIIGTEEHYSPGAFIEYIRSRQDPLGHRIEVRGSTVEQRLEDMEEAGIDMQVLSVGMMGLQELPPAEGTALSREMDDDIAEVVKKYPDKFAGLAAIAPQDPEAAADELERAVKKLGLRGTMINSHINGEYLDEEKYWVILERAASLGVPIYIHPNLPSPDMIKPYLKYPQLASAAWGFAAETGLHAMRLICSGVFDKYPDLKIMLGHMGESLPYWLWRLDRHWQGRMGEVAQQTKKKPSEYIKENFYITTSGMFWPPVIQFAYLVLGADRIMFGVDYPLEDSKLAVQAVENTPMCDGDKEKIFHLNAEKVLNL